MLKFKIKQNLIKMKKLIKIILFFLNFTQLHASGIKTLQYLEQCNNSMKTSRINNDNETYTQNRQNALDVIMHPNPNVRHDAKIKAEQFDVCRRIIQQTVIVDKNKGQSSTVLAIDNNSALLNEAGYKHFAILSVLYMGSWYINDNPDSYFNNRLPLSFYNNRLINFSKYINMSNTKLYDTLRSYITNFSMSNFEHIMGNKFIPDSADLSRNYPDVCQKTQQYIDVSDYVTSRKPCQRKFENGFTLYFNANPGFVKIPSLAYWHYKGSQNVVYDPKFDDLYVTYDVYNRHSHSYLMGLPDEIVLSIVDHLSGKDFAHIKSTNKKLLQISEDDSLYLPSSKNSILLDYPWQSLFTKAMRVRWGFNDLINRISNYLNSTHNSKLEFLNSPYGTQNLINVFSTESFRITNQEFSLNKFSNRNSDYPSIGISSQTIHTITNILTEYLTKNWRMNDEMNVNLIKFILYGYKVYDDKKNIAQAVYQEFSDTHIEAVKTLINKYENIYTVITSSKLLNHVGVLYYFDGKIDQAREILQKSIDKQDLTAKSLLSYINLHYYLGHEIKEVKKLEYNYIYNNIDWSKNFKKWFHLKKEIFLEFDQVLNLFLKGQYWNNSNNIDSMNKAINELKKGMIYNIKNKVRYSSGEDHSKEKIYDQDLDIIAVQLQALWECDSNHSDIIGELENLINLQNNLFSNSEIVLSKLCGLHNTEAGNACLRRGEFYLKKNNKNAAGWCFQDAKRTGNREAVSYLKALRLQHEINAD